MPSSPRSPDPEGAPTPPPGSRRGGVGRPLTGVLIIGLSCITIGVGAGQIFRAAGAGPASLPASELPPGVPAAGTVPEAAPTAPGGTGPAERTSFLSRLVPPPAEAPRATGPSRSVEELVRRLPLERKVAQLMLVGFRGTDATSPVLADLRRRDLGGVVVAPGNYSDPRQLAELTGEMRAAARAARHTAPWVLTEQEGGRYSAIRELPPSLAPGEMLSARTAERSAASAGRALRLVGVNGVLAPVVDVGTEGSGPSGSRLFSDDPDEVARYAAAAVRGYSRARVLVAPKHFPGLGAATQPTEAGPATVGLSVRELAQRDLRPFAAAVDARTPAVVVGHGLYPDENYTVPASLSRATTAGLLRRDLGFRGVAITDDLASPGLTGAATSIPETTVGALRAGADMVWISGERADQEAAYFAMLNAVRQGQLPRRRVDEAALRVLQAKQRLGLTR